jgi:preprotein translocase subunit SecA
MSMLTTVGDKLFGTKHERAVKKMRPVVAAINELGPRFEGWEVPQLESRITEIRGEIDRAIEGLGIEEKALSRTDVDPILDHHLPEVFAIVRETAHQVLGMRHFDVQLIGGMVLHQGKIAEMKTGEGKTLVATLPVVLNALAGRGVHVITVNDYLARRDAEWMGRVYRALGLSVAVVVHGLTTQERYDAYHSDIAYGHNSEFGFDFLRDNMKTDLKLMVQRTWTPHWYSIVDEVDSILVDEARTPLIISGPSEFPSENYVKVDRVIPRLKAEIDYTLDEKSRSAMLTPEGIQAVEQSLALSNLYDPDNLDWLHHVNQGLRAHTLFKRDRDYAVKEGEVIIIDEFTGRLMQGRRWSDGLHQAVEAKEGIKPERENQTLATITYQKYFIKYHKLSGMTGTADTEAEEFQKVYNLDVVVVPTNKPVIRDDRGDLVFLTQEGKFEAVVEDIEDSNERGQPVLVGTVSVEKSELLSRMLKRKGLDHEVLNAKQHAREAVIVAQAGRRGMVTIATNMAGRGTDIILGGNPVELARNNVGARREDEEEREYYERLATVTEEYRELCGRERNQVLEAGGLHIIGTERHESRRIDNQLRGRAGRQGDPGSSRFFVSLEDDLMRIFGSEKIKSLFQSRFINMQEDEALEHKWISKSIENAQTKVEGSNFNSRKNVLYYDNVLSEQREAVYGRRRAILEVDDMRDEYFAAVEAVIGDLVDRFVPERPTDEQPLDVAGLKKALRGTLHVNLDLDEAFTGAELGGDGLVPQILALYDTSYQTREDLFTPEQLRRYEREVLLRTLDDLWRDHLKAMDYLRAGVGLRGYGQRNPLLEYKKEGFEMFTIMMDRWEERVVERVSEQLFGERDLTQEEIERMLAARARARAKQSEQVNKLGGAQPSDRPKTVRRESAKVGRNEPCPCGSGKKYKKCCMLGDQRAAAGV